MFNSNSVKQVLFGAGLRLTLQFINSLCLKKVIVDQVYMTGLQRDCISCLMQKFAWLLLVERGRRLLITVLQMENNLLCKKFRYSKIKQSICRANIASRVNRLPTLLGTLMLIYFKFYQRTFEIKLFPLCYTVDLLYSYLDISRHHGIQNLYITSVIQNRPIIGIEKRDRNFFCFVYLAPTFNLLLIRVKVNQ